jgi:hypothetical protein
MFLLLLGGGFFVVVVVFLMIPKAQATKTKIGRWSY